MKLVLRVLGLLQIAPEAHQGRAACLLKEAVTNDVEHWCEKRRQARAKVDGTLQFFAALSRCRRVARKKTAGQAFW